MRTFWAVRHMARVEWVTVQVRASQSSGGFVKSVGVVEGVVVLEEAYLEGMRRVMEDCCVSEDMM